jgi:hypothetical protein
LVGVEGGSNNGIILGGLPSGGNRLDVGLIFAFDFCAGLFVWTLVVLLLVAAAAEVVSMWRVASALSERRRSGGDPGTAREKGVGDGFEESVGDEVEATPFLPTPDSSSRDERIASGASSILASHTSAVAPFCTELTGHHPRNQFEWDSS